MTEMEPGAAGCKARMLSIVLCGPPKEFLLFAKSNGISLSTFPQFSSGLRNVNYLRLLQAPIVMLPCVQALMFHSGLSTTIGSSLIVVQLYCFHSFNKKETMCLGAQQNHIFMILTNHYPRLL